MVVSFISDLSRCFGCADGFSWSFTVNLAENRQQERCSLPRTCGHKENQKSQRERLKNQTLMYPLLSRKLVYSVCVRVCVLPVCAQAMRSRLDLTIGMAYFWTGVGLV